MSIFKSKEEILIIRVKELIKRLKAHNHTILASSGEMTIRNLREAMKDPIVQGDALLKEMSIDNVTSYIEGAERSLKLHKESHAELVEFMNRHGSVASFKKKPYKGHCEGCSAARV